MNNKSEERIIAVAQGILVACIGFLMVFLRSDALLAVAVAAIVELVAVAVLVVMVRNLYKFRGGTRGLLLMDRILFILLSLAIIICAPFLTVQW